MVSCSATLAAPLTPMLGLLGAPPPLVRLLVRASLSVALPLLIPPLLRAPSRLMCCLLPCCLWGSTVARAWTRGRSFVTCVTARGRVAAYGSASLGRSSALWDVLLCCRAACYFAARGAPCSLTPGLVGILRLLCDCLWGLRRLPLVVAPLLRVLSFEVAVLPPTLPLLGLRCRSCMDLWALLRPLRDCSRVCRPHPCSVRCLSWLLCCLVLRRLWGPVVGDA